MSIPGLKNEIIERAIDKEDEFVSEEDVEW